MRHFYQSEWQGIRFSDIADVSSTELARSEFYSAFYCTLFERYKGYSDLGHNWRLSKDEIAQWIVGRLPNEGRVLSIGCGLGYIEQYLWNKCGDRIELHASDYANDALRWLKEVMPAERIHDMAENSIDSLPYDFIYLSAVDYAMDDQELVNMLAQYRDKLTETGKLLLISASYYEESSAQYFVRYFKDGLKAVLDSIGLRSRGQFWGWMRTRDEYRSLVNDAGFSEIKDGYIEISGQSTYWIEGQKRNNI